MESYANFVCDLHGHTNRSDGNDTPEEYLRHASRRRMKVVAITDHDKVPPDTVIVNGEEREITEYARSLGLTLLKGIEISCETEIEDVHLVCFGYRFDSPYFEELDRFTVQSKICSYKELVRRLTKTGRPLSWEEVLENAGNPIREEEVQKKMIFNLMAKKGYAGSWSEAKLLVKNDERLCISREKPDAVKVIHEIHRQGGIVILAHPYLIHDPVHYHGRRLGRQEFIDLLICEGLDGIEGRYTYDKTSYNGDMSKEEIYKDVIKQYQGRISVISGGSDYHGDGKKGIDHPREIGECGLTEEEFYSNPILRKLAEPV